jgi:hypothetical protein
MYQYNSIPERMEYIQNLFLEAGALARTAGGWQELLPLLDQEPDEYRSVGYEGFSFELAMKDIDTMGALGEWKEFRTATQEHAFHLDIGLGWALAKREVAIGVYIDSVDSITGSMILDGIGYYHALFKGRNTLKNKYVPAELEQQGLSGFDQGVGRRLWYMAKGNVQEAVNLLHGFPFERRGDLFRGVGIACGYVGGNSEKELRILEKLSAEHKDQLQLGIALASLSRILSNSVTPSVQRSYQIICGKSDSHLDISLTDATKKFLYLYNNGDNSNNWFARFKSDLLQSGL